MEQAAPQAQRDRLAAAPGTARRGGVLTGARRLGRRLGAPAGGVGHGVRAAPRPGRRDQPLAARPDARRLTGQLRAHDAPLVVTGGPAARWRRAARRAAVLRL